MGSLNTQTFGGYVVHSYTDIDEASSLSWLAVVVVWRRRDSAVRRVWRDRLRALRYRLGMDVVHARFHFGGDALHWHGTAGPLGERETLFHEVRRVVRVLSKEIAMPEVGHTLFLFLDEAPSDGHRATFLIRAMSSEQRPESSHVIAAVSASSSPSFLMGEPLHALALRDEEVRTFLGLDTHGTR